jgi:hypothetical protein
MIPILQSQHLLCPIHVSAVSSEDVLTRPDFQGLAKISRATDSYNKAEAVR